MSSNTVFAASEGTVADLISPTLLMVKSSAAAVLATERAAHEDVQHSKNMPPKSGETNTD